MAHRHVICCIIRFEFVSIFFLLLFIYKSILWIHTKIVTIYELSHFIFPFLFTQYANHLFRALSHSIAQDENNHSFYVYCFLSFLHRYLSKLKKNWIFAHEAHLNLQMKTNNFYKIDCDKAEISWKHSATQIQRERKRKEKIQCKKLKIKI